MPASPQVPSSLRYFKARLRILKRPKVWGMAAGLLAVLLLAGDYWNHPTRYQLSRGSSPRDRSSQSALDAPLPAEDRAIGIDIDSLPVLLNDWQLEGDFGGDRTASQEQLPSPAAELPSPSPADTPSPGSPLSLLGSPTPTASPHSAQAETAEAANSAGAAPFSFDRLFTSEPAPSPPANRLQTALDRYAPSNNAAPAQATEPQASVQSGGRDSAGAASESAQPPADQPVLPPSLSYPIQPSTGQRQSVPRPAYIPQTAPPPGTTGYTLPPSLNRSPVASPSASNAFTQLVVPQPVPGLPAPVSAPASRSGLPLAPGSSSGAPYPSPAAQPQPVQPPPAAFSVPRAVPGRSIGNGEINTFSNP